MPRIKEVKTNLSLKKKDRINCGIQNLKLKNFFTILILWIAKKLILKIMTKMCKSNICFWELKIYHPTSVEWRTKIKGKIYQQSSCSFEKNMCAFFAYNQLSCEWAGESCTFAIWRVEWKTATTTWEQGS